MLSILPTSHLSLSLLPQLMKRRQSLRTRLERLYLKKTGQASSSLLFYSTQWMEIRIRNHSGLNGRASALALTPVIRLPVCSGHFYLIFKSMRPWQWTLCNFHCCLFSSLFCKGWSLLFSLVLWLHEKRPLPLLASTLAKPFLDNSSHIIMEHFDRKVGFASTVSFFCSSMGGVGVLGFLPVEFLLWIFFRTG